MVPIEAFVGVALAILTLLLTSHIILANKNQKLDRAQGQDETSIENNAAAIEALNETIKGINNEIGLMKVNMNATALDNQKQRQQDHISFVEMLGKFNLSIVRFDETLKHFSKTVDNFRTEIREEIHELKEQVQSKQDKRKS